MAGAQVSAGDWLGLWTALATVTALGSLYLLRDCVERAGLLVASNVELRELIDSLEALVDHQREVIDLDTKFIDEHVAELERLKGEIERAALVADGLALLVKL